MSPSLKLIVLSALLNTARRSPRAAQHLNSSSNNNSSSPSSILQLRSINEDADRKLLETNRDGDDSAKSYDGCLEWLIGQLEPRLGNARRRRRRGRTLEGIPRSHVNDAPRRRRRRMTASEYDYSLRLFPKDFQQKITKTDDVEERLAMVLSDSSVVDDDTFASFVEKWRKARTGERKGLRKLLKETKTKDFNNTVAIYQDIRSEEIIPTKRESISKLWQKTEDWNSPHRRNQIKMFEMALKEEKQVDDQQIKQLRIKLNVKKQTRTTTTTTTTTTIPIDGTELETTESTTNSRNYLKTDYKKTAPVAVTKGVSGGTIGLVLGIFVLAMIAVTLPVYVKKKTTEEIPITEEEKKKLLEKKEEEKREKEEKKRLKEEKKRKKKEAKQKGGKEQSKKPEEKTKAMDGNQGKANDEKKEAGKQRDK